MATHIPDLSDQLPAATLGQLWPVLVDRFGDDPALRSPTDRLSYRELDQRQREVATGLSRRGIGRGDRIAIWLPNRIEWVIAQLACATLGAVVVPINARFRAPEMARVLVDSEATTLILTDRFMTNDYHDRAREVLPELDAPGTSTFASAPALREVISVSLDPLPGMTAWATVVADGRDGEPPASNVAASDPFLAFWTSGTTGKPKGIVHDASALENVWNWTSHLGYRAEDRVLVNHPLFYIAGNFWGLLGALLHGAEAALVPDLAPSTVLRYASQWQITILSGSPSRLSSLVDATREAGADEPLRLRAGFVGGESTSPSQIRRIKEALGYETLLQVYGMTELQGFCMTTSPADSDEIVGTTVGRPLPGFEVKVAAPETGEEVPVGEEGELLVKGRTPSRFVGLSPEDRARLIDADGWFHTGDILTRRLDGNYEFRGRIKDLIKVGGENVAAAEVEAALGEHPAIKTVVAMGVPDEAMTERVVAFVEFGDGQRATTESLRSWAAQRMAPYKQPAAYLEVSEWPKTESGKVARAELKTALSGTTDQLTSAAPFVRPL